MPSIFSQIIEGTETGIVVYQDSHCIVLMDIFPVVRGHVLVIPRKEHIRIQELTPALRAHLFEVANAMTEAMEASELSKRGAHIVINDGKSACQTVPHVHLHIVPRRFGDAFPLPALIYTIARKLLRRPVSTVELERVAQKLTAHLPQSLSYNE